MPRSPSRTPSYPVEGMAVSSKHIQRSRCLPQTVFEAYSGVKGISRFKKIFQASKEVLVMSRAFIRMACSRATGGRTSHKAPRMSEALKDSTAHPATPRKPSFAMDPSMMSPGLQVNVHRCVICMPHP